MESLCLPPPRTRWSGESIRDMLRNPVYLGKIRWNYKTTVKGIIDGRIVYHRPRNYEDCLIVEGRHPAIIDQATFDAASLRFGREPRRRGERKLKNSFASLARCAACGRSLTLQHYQRICQDGHIPVDRLVCLGQSKCHTKSITYAAFTDAVVEALHQHIGTLTYQIQTVDDGVLRLHRSLVERAEKALAEINEQQLRLYDLLETGIYDKEIFVQRNTALAAKRTAAEAALEEAKQSEKQTEICAQTICGLQDAIDALQDPDVSPNLKNIFLRRVIERIDYTCTAPPRVKYSPFTIDIHLKADIFSG